MGAWFYADDDVTVLWNSSNSTISSMVLYCPEQLGINMKEILATKYLYDIMSKSNNCEQTDFYTDNLKYWEEFLALRDTVWHGECRIHPSVSGECVSNVMSPLVSWWLAAGNVSIKPWVGTSKKTWSPLISFNDMLRVLPYKHKLNTHSSWSVIKKHSYLILKTLLTTFNFLRF